MQVFVRVRSIIDRLSCSPTQHAARTDEDDDDDDDDDGDDDDDNDHDVDEAMRFREVHDRPVLESRYWVVNLQRAVDSYIFEVATMESANAVCWKVEKAKATSSLRVHEESCVHCIVITKKTVKV